MLIDIYTYIYYVYYIYYVNLYLVQLWYSDTIDLYDLHDNCHCYHSWYSCWSMCQVWCRGRQRIQSAKHFSLDLSTSFDVLIVLHWGNTQSLRCLRDLCHGNWPTGKAKCNSSAVPSVQLCNSCATRVQLVCFSQDMFHHFFTICFEELMVSFLSL